MSMINFEETAVRSNYTRAIYGIRKSGGNWWLTIADQKGNADYLIQSDDDANAIIAAMREDFIDRSDSTPSDDPIFNALRGIKLGIPDFMENDDPVIRALASIFYGVR